ncbi:MAG: Mpo1-like protein [Kangiellaceae bacterium]|jgi:uncharacterized membrane protein YGL010W|nr:Mpo1-like protein [Kangiellaceae bacterium]
MKTASEWLDEYGESHQNKTNKLIHWLCVPAIFWSVILMVWSIPVPTALQVTPWLNWATIGLAVIMLFYVIISIKLSVGMLVFSAAMVWLSSMVADAAAWPTWQIGLVIFVVAWVLQFIGHKIEGKKPSFFKDILFLLVGPAWLMGFVYQRLGLAIE